MAESFVTDHGHGHQRCERGFNRPYDMDTSRLLDLGIRHHIQRSLAPQIKTDTMPSSFSKNLNCFCPIFARNFKHLTDLISKTFWGDFQTL